MCKLSSHHNGVFERLALCRGRHFRVGKSDDARPESVRGRFKRKSRACAGLEKQGGDNASVEELAVGAQFKFVRHLHEIQDFLARKVRDTHQAAVCGHESLSFGNCFTPSNLRILAGDSLSPAQKISSFSFLVDFESTLNVRSRQRAKRKVRSAHGSQGKTVPLFSVQKTMPWRPVELKSRSQGNTTNERSKSATAHRAHSLLCGPLSSASLTFLKSRRRCP